LGVAHLGEGATRTEAIIVQAVSTSKAPSDYFLQNTFNYTDDGGAYKIDGLDAWNLEQE